MFCLYLGESLLGTLVELQLHHVDGISSLHRDIDSALCRMLLHEDIITSEQGEHDVERLLPMPLVVGVVAVRHRLQEVVQQTEGSIHIPLLHQYRHLGNGRVSLRRLVRQIMRQETSI